MDVMEISSGFGVGLRMGVMEISSGSAQGLGVEMKMDVMEISSESGMRLRMDVMEISSGFGGSGVSSAVLRSEIQRPDERLGNGARAVDLNMKE
ncbi:uncharacterized [Tachysurus ichikawai]